jgi:hypothetical protein
VVDGPKYCHHSEVIHSVVACYDYQRKQIVVVVLRIVAEDTSVFCGGFGLPRGLVTDLRLVDR